MLSQTDRKSDGLVIANGSQTVAVTAPETEGSLSGQNSLVFMAEYQDQGLLSQGSARGRVAERFFAKVSAELGCWIWKASTSHSGYGQFWDGRTMVRAHRWAYELANGPIPADVECDHTCGVRRCVNPEHIELVTHAENIRRRDAGKPPSKAELRRRERIESGWWVCI